MSDYPNEASVGELIGSGIKPLEKYSMRVLRSLELVTSAISESDVASTRAVRKVVGPTQ